MARIPGDRADWDAELGRSVGKSDPDAWQDAAATWQRLGRPHRAAYALWRQAEALLARSAHTVTRRSRCGPRPRLPPAWCRCRVRSTVWPSARASRSTHPSTKRKPHRPGPMDPYGLTKRERLVLHLVARGYTNAQIGAELFMSPKTASVHVTNILRKLNVLNRTEAAALAERAGLIEDQRGV